MANIEMECNVCGDRILYNPATDGELQDCEFCGGEYLEIEKW
jgi:hypothetical protein